MYRVAALADYTAPFAVGAVATLRIAEFFREGTRTAESVAAESGLDPNALQRLLRALVAKGLFSEPETGVFSLTASSQFLLDSHPWSLRSAYMLMPADVCAWGGMKYSLRTGRGAFEHAHGQSLWEYLSERPEESAQFDSSMEGLSRLETVWLLEAYDWTQFGTVVDVGGGNGAMLLALLTTFPSLRGVLFDLPQVVARALGRAEMASVQERCQIESGNFFTRVPAGYDAYVLKRIVYSYDDSEAIRILQRVRAGMRQDSRILLLEPVLRKGSGFDYGKLLDIQMLILGGGRVRDRHGLRHLLGTAGLRLRRVIPTPMAAIVEGLPE